MSTRRDELIVAMQELFEAYAQSSSCPVVVGSCVPMTREATSKSPPLMDEGRFDSLKLSRAVLGPLSFRE